MEEQEKIELRSEKVRNVIRQRPPFMVRWGTVLVLLLLFLLCYITYVIGIWPRIF